MKTKQRIVKILLSHCYFMTLIVTKIYLLIVETHQRWRKNVQKKVEEPSYCLLLSAIFNIIASLWVIHEWFSPISTNQSTVPAHTRPDYSSDSEIESIESTCTWARNYKLPARYIYPRNICNTDSNVTTNTLLILLLYQILIHLNVDVLVMIWKQRMTMKMKMKMKM